MLDLTREKIKGVMMKITSRTEIGATTLLVACLLSLSALGDAVILGTFGKIGSDADTTISGTSNGGATMTYVADTDRKYDSGVFFYTDSASGGVTFANVGDKLTYNFTYTGIIATGNLSSPQFRTGFDFGSTAFLYHTTSVGSQAQLAFRSNDNGNPFSGGSQTGDTILDWSDYAHRGIRFDDGNVINGTVSLTLNADNGNGTYDYLYEVFYVNGAFANSASQIFYGVTGANVVSISHLSNVSTMSVAGDTWTVTGASATMVPEPATLGLVAVAAGGLLFLRRLKT